MAECIFCRILAGGLPAEIVYEAKGAIAFLDTYPRTRGHTLVVPRAHAPTLLELDDAGIGELFVAVKTVSRKVRDALGAVGLNVGWNHGAAAGQHVMHLHVHILPRYAPGGPGIQGIAAGPPGGTPAQVAAAIRAA